MLQWLKPLLAININDCSLCLTAGLLQRILFGEGNQYLEENEIYVLQEERWKLFSVFITVNTVHPPTEDVSESTCPSSRKSFNATEDPHKGNPRDGES